MCSTENCNKEKAKGVLNQISMLGSGMYVMCSVSSSAKRMMTAVCATVDWNSYRSRDTKSIVHSCMVAHAIFGKL